MFKKPNQKIQTIEPFKAVEPWAKVCLIPCLVRFSKHWFL